MPASVVDELNEGFSLIAEGLEADLELNPHPNLQHFFACFKRPLKRKAIFSFGDYGKSASQDVAWCVSQQVQRLLDLPEGKRPEAIAAYAPDTMSGDGDDDFAEGYVIVDADHADSVFDNVDVYQGIPSYLQEELMTADVSKLTCE